MSTTIPEVSLNIAPDILADALLSDAVQRATNHFEQNILDFNLKPARWQFTWTMDNYNEKPIKVLLQEWEETFDKREVSTRFTHKERQDELMRTVRMNELLQQLQRAKRSQLVTKISRLLSEWRESEDSPK